MTIVCLGWGSLIWNPGGLPIRGKWQPDGPAVPVEFVRKSNNGRITLVIAEDVERIPVLWSELDVPSVEEARTTLADREGISRKNAQRLIGVWSPASPGGFAGSAAIAEWAASKGFSGVVWTALGPSFPDMRGKPSCDQVVGYLSKLDGETKRLAEEYVRRTPAQIKTSYRARIEQELGWTPID